MLLAELALDRRCDMQHNPFLFLPICISLRLYVRFHKYRYK